MTTLGKLTFEVLVRPKGSTDEPTVVGEITLDLDTKKAEVPAPIPPLPTEPVAEPLPEYIAPEEPLPAMPGMLAEFIDPKTQKGAR